jgi:hypothetical protein
MGKNDLKSYSSEFNIFSRKTNHFLKNRKYTKCFSLGQENNKIPKKQLTLILMITGWIFHLAKFLK